MHMKILKVALGTGALATIVVLAVLAFNAQKVAPAPALAPVTTISHGDRALLAIIRNDQAAFEKYINEGGQLGTKLEAEGGIYNVGELVVKYERTGFVKFLKDKGLSFNRDLMKDFDVQSIAVKKNNPEILSMLIEGQDSSGFRTYGANDESLLHMAGADCSYKVIEVLNQAGLKWDEKAKDGSTPLTAAADAGCLQALSYAKEQGVDFKKKDGRGKSALGILNTNNDAATVAFAESFSDRRNVAAVALNQSQAAPNFYKKRAAPKDIMARRGDLIEPEDRPEDANETAEFAEFSD